MEPCITTGTQKQDGSETLQRSLLELRQQNTRRHIFGHTVFGGVCWAWTRQERHSGPSIRSDL